MNLYGNVLKRIDQFFSKFHFILPSGERFTLIKPKEKKEKPIFKSLSQQLQFQKKAFEKQPEKWYTNFFHSYGNQEEHQDSLIINENTIEIDASSSNKNNIAFNVKHFDSKGHINNNLDSTDNQIIFSIAEEKNKRINSDNQLQENRDVEEDRALVLRGNDTNKTILQIANEQVSNQYKTLIEAVNKNTLEINRTLSPSQESKPSSTLIIEGKEYINSKDQGNFYLFDTKYTIRDDKTLVLNFENNNVPGEPSMPLWPELPNFPVPILDGFTIYGRVPNPIANLLEMGLRNIHGIKSGLKFYSRPDIGNNIIIDFDKDKEGNIIYQKDNEGKALEGALIGKINSQFQLELFFDKNYYKDKGEIV